MSTYLINNVNAQGIDFKGGYSPYSIVDKIYANHYDGGPLIALVPNYNSKYSKFDSGTPLSTWDESAYIEIEVKDGGLKLEDDGDMVVYTRRVAQGSANDNPIAFKVTGQFAGSPEWRDLFNVYFVYRGYYTDEYSSRIPIKSISDKVGGGSGNLTKMRFYIIATNGNVASDTKNIAMAMNRFDVLKIGENDNYSDTFKDRFHLTSDYRNDLSNYKFRHTQGIFDDVNRVAGWEKISDTEKDLLKNDYGITIPEFELISNSSTKNKPICTLSEGQKLQPTHEVEHILYAMPGDVINLYPYYELYHTDQFKENFSHWYDYRTGGHIKYPTTDSSNQWATNCNLLDFLTDPEKIQYSEKEGYFAGFGMAGYSDMHEYIVTTPQEYINAVNEINTHKEFSYITINAPAGLDFAGTSNVPMLGDGYAFQGIINGNGTTIKNLKYEKAGTNGVGLIGKGGGTVVVKNLILDKTCTFTGNKQIGGIIGYLESGSLNVSDIRTEASLHSVANISDQNAAGILGSSSGNCTGFKISNCYIGGNIGENNNDNAFNAAVVAGWWGAINNSSLKNVVVDCNLIKPDESGNGPRFYIRHGGSNQDVVISETGIKSRGGISFENCYGNLQSNDECWIPLVYLTEVPASGKNKLQNASWNINSMLPPMTDSYTGPGYSKVYSIATVKQYIDAIEEINTNTSYSTSYIELTADLDFENRTDIPMIGTESNNFGGRFNGRGHTIRNLFIDKSETENVGLFAWVKSGVVVENLMVDKSCVISGKNYVGLIGRLNNGSVVIQNVKTEATVKANTTGGWGHLYYGSFAGGILGCCADGNNDKSLNLKNVFIGGVIGKGGNVYNSAITPYFYASASTSESVFENVVIICNVMGVNSTSGRQYINNMDNGIPNVTQQADGSYIKTMTNNKGSFQFKFINCYGNVDPDDKTFEYLTTSINKPIASWLDSQTPAMTGIINKGYNLSKGNDKNRLEEHKPGSVATFFCPKNPFEGMYQSLPFPSDFSEEEREYVIAADFSKTFNLVRHLDVDENILSEPIIAFRHIFKIRDGKEFADNYFGSYTDNRKYVRRNLKFVSARCNVPFQIRLTTPVPVTVGSSVPTNIYYKKAADEYARVCGKMEIILLDGDTREVIPVGDPKYTKFEFGEEFQGVGQREIDKVNYSIGDGNNKFYRMLKCTPPGAERNYIVQLVATENPDDPNKRIKVYMDPVKDADVPADVSDPYLIVAEYHVRFLPLKGATMLTMDDLYDKEEYTFARVETLEEKFHSPIDVINFDEYLNINTFDNVSLRNKLISLNETKDIYGTEITPNKNTKYKVKNSNLYHTFFKWPIPWDKANYAYGYDYTDGYNMYMLATHSDMVRYKQAVLLRDYYTYDGTSGRPDYTDKTALQAIDPQPIKGNRNADYHGKGLYDVKYYRTKRKVDEYYALEAQTANQAVDNPVIAAAPKAVPEIEQGYFYWGNAASDPGVATRLEINDLCAGSTIHVSAWIAEFSIDQEATNLSFNFVAVMKKDNENLGVKAGDRIVLHSFITGYVPDGGKFYYVYDRDNNGNIIEAPSGSPYSQYHWIYNLNDGKQYYDLNNLKSYSIYRNNGQTTTTGKDDDMRGQWLNVYYSFVPRLAEFDLSGISTDDVYFELELDNNAKSSAGADFGIDDIRIYLEPPMVDVSQLKPACDNASTRLKLVSPFETLLEIVGQAETLSDNAGEHMAAYYTFINKPNFDSLYQQYKDENVSDPGKKAYDQSVVKFNYNRGGDDEVHSYGKVTFNSNYNKNQEYVFDAEAIPSGIAYKSTDADSGERFIIFESDVAPGKFDIGSEYYVVLKAAVDDEESLEGNEWNFFDMFGDCSNKNVLTIRPSQIVKLDGVIEPKLDDISVCEHQSPVIQVNVWGTDDTTGEMVEVQKNSRFDWFYGLMTDDASGLGFKNIHEEGNNDHTLENALWVFRKRYPDAESTAGIVADGEDYVGENDSKLEEWMLRLIEKYSSPSNTHPIPLLSLYQTSYVMPPLKIKEGSADKAGHVVVIPIINNTEQENFIVCTSPVQLNIKIGQKSPNLKHGLIDIDYPSDLDDVPLRIGIDQLKTNLTELDGRDSRTIDIPVRKSTSSDGNTSKRLKIIKETVHTFDSDNNLQYTQKEGAVILVQTNDPEYKDLGTLDKNEEETETLLWVGEIKRLQAETNKENITQYFQVKFDDSFNFKEGYFYRFRFQYEEDGAADDESICNGQDVFTLKIVPRYLAWTGENSLNWNDDGNWRRVTGKTNDSAENDLYLDQSKTKTLAHYVTNGSQGDGYVNTNTMAYSPLDFTHVIVESGMKSPFLYHPASERSGSNGVRDEYDGTRKYVWPSNPEKGSDKVQDDDPGADGVGKVTPLIHFDMAAFEFVGTNRREDAEVGCRPWYANTCKEIHFKPGGTIMNQQELVYKKAWVDVELDHSRWQTVSTPLKEVFAGDFYLPSDGARQATELYQDITFSKGTNDRFTPAVFQRGWDKSVANVYEIDASKAEVGSPRNVAVKTFWSHVYNDVMEQYGSGNGFSIKTDISAMTSNKPLDGDKVLFRLPKADTEYLYWNKDGSKSGHKTSIGRGEGQYRLNDSQGTLTAVSAGKCEYFLIGNPFMTHMDIQKFLDENSETLEQRYWVVTKNGQIAGEFSGDTIVVADPSDDEDDEDDEDDGEDKAEDPTVIAPMQGFFVQTRIPAQSVTLTYNESMMRRYSSSDKSKCLIGTTRSESGGMLRIVAENYGNPSSAALLGINDGSNWNVEAIDNRDIDIPSIVYTVGNGMALSINSVKEAEGTEIGVIADDDTETVIRFEGVEVVEGLYLLDKADRSLTPLEKGLQLTVSGAAAGRFFLTYGIADEGMMSGIEWKVDGGVLKVVDNAASGSIEVNVFDTMGRLVKRDSTNEEMLEMKLEHGIYVVEIRTAKECKSIKVRI